MARFSMKCSEILKLSSKDGRFVTSSALGLKRSAFQKMAAWLRKLFRVKQPVKSYPGAFFDAKDLPYARGLFDAIKGQPGGQVSNADNLLEQEVRRTLAECRESHG